VIAHGQPSLADDLTAALPEVQSTPNNVARITGNVARITGKAPP
jgi:hypothetical protein